MPNLFDDVMRLKGAIFTKGYSALIARGDFIRGAQKLRPNFDVTVHFVQILVRWVTDNGSALLP